MRQAAGQAHITVITIVLIGLIMLLGSILIPRLTNNTLYSSCCNEVGGIWESGKCKAKTPTTCSDRDDLYKAYDECVSESGKNNSKEKYKAVACN